MSKAKPAFYDPSKSYEDNFTDGPALLSLKLTPPNRKFEDAKQFSFLGFPINTPFGIPAGPLLNAQYIKAAFDFGFDVSVYKTQRTVPFTVNQFPNVLYVDVADDLTLELAKKPLVGKREINKPKEQYSITNSFGNPSRGPAYWQEDLKKALSYQKPGQLLIMSVVGTIQEGFSEEDYHNDFAEAARLANETGVKVIEVNLSCPNVANEGVICFNPEADEAIARKAKEQIGDTPLLVKLGYFRNDQEELLTEIIKRISPFVAGVSAINTIPAPVVDEHGHQALPGPNRLMSGICGACIKWAGTDMVKKLSRIREKLHKDFAIIGVGGVMTQKDYTDYKAAGADLVQSATGAMWNPYLAQQIWEKENEI